MNVMFKKFLDKVKSIILNHLNDEDFNVGKLADYLRLSRSQTFRKIKASTGLTANEYIREIRLKEAAELLKDESLTISEISYRVGFNNPSYFSKCFHEKYNFSPVEYREKILARNTEEIPKTNHLKARDVLVIIWLIFTFFLLLWWVQVKYNQTRPVQYATIAVLTLCDYSKNEGNDYLATVLTNSIKSELHKISGLVVTKADLTIQNSDTLKSYQQLAKDLEVDLILEGTIYNVGEDLHLIFQLIDPVPNEQHIWNKVYYEPNGDFLKLSAILSSDIAHEIEKNVLNKEVNFFR